MDNLEKKVFETIQKYNLIQRGDRIVVAVSGGPDSICLLDILNKIKNKNCQLNPEPVAINCQLNPEPMAPMAIFMKGRCLWNFLILILI